MDAGPPTADADVSHAAWRAAKEWASATDAGTPTAVDALPIEPARAWGDHTLWKMFRCINPKWIITALVVTYLGVTFTSNVVISDGALVALVYAGNTLILVGTSALIMSSIRMKVWDRWWRRTHLILLKIHMNQRHDGLSPQHGAGCQCTYINSFKGPALVTLPPCKRIPWSA